MEIYRKLDTIVIRLDKEGDARGFCMTLFGQQAPLDPQRPVTPEELHAGNTVWANLCQMVLELGTNYNAATSLKKVG